MPGVKALLKAAATDIEQTQKASVPAKNKSNKDDAKSVAPASTVSTAQDLSDEPKAKHPGGRPTNKEKGIQSRKQYTLTLKANLYKQILENARAEDLSFSKYMERAVLEYMEKHS
jgi:hypothetical protein